jgi:hypothetical protein
VKRLLIGLPILLFISCGGGGGGGTTPPPPVVRVVISPTTASVATGFTQQFTATVTGTTNTAVTWQVDGVTGGNSTVGTISTSGLYTAPASIPSPATVTVQAVSQADNTKTASATVTVVTISVTVKPASAMMVVNATQQFTATVTGTSNGAVTWQVNGTTGGNSTTGTISASGLYTAPSSVPNPPTVAVTAISQADSTKTASATVTIAAAYSNAFLNGSYAFILTGNDLVTASGGGFFVAAGSFAADGQGGIQNGVQDLVSGLYTQAFTSLSFTGTYSVGVDGRGTLTMSYLVNGAPVTDHFRLLVETNSRARLIGFDTNSASSGLVLLRDASASSSLNGNYSFGFDGGDSKGDPVLSIAGRFSADGAGNITAGLEDLNDGGNISQSVTFTGTYTLDAVTGRGTMVLKDSLSETLNFAFYTVTEDTVVFVETDFNPAVAGLARLQQAAFSTSSLVGDYAFSLATPAGNGSLVVGGRFTSNGTGGISAGQLAANIMGAVANGSFTTGTASVAASGRGMLNWVTTIGTVNFVIYMVSPQEAFALQTDTGNLASGTIVAQQGGPFDNSSLSGSFGFNALAGNVNVNEIGQLSANGEGSFTSGTLDVNFFSSQSTGSALTSGSYSVSSDGSGTATISTAAGTSHYSVYMVSPSKAFLIGTDSQEVSSGSMEKQF